VQAKEPEHEEAPPKEEKQESKQEQQTEDQFDESSPQFKTYRRVLYMIGKSIKYTIWGAFGIFLYHMFLVKKYEKPETAMLVSQPFLEAARFIDWSIYDFRVLMTMPGMNKMLPDRMSIPGQPM